MSVGLTTPRVRAHRAAAAAAAQQTKTPEKHSSWRPWKKKPDEKNITEKLLIPLPVPHPVHIAISVFNRDAEHPIPLDSELVWEILKSIEDCEGGDMMVGVIAFLESVRLIFYEVFLWISWHKSSSTDSMSDRKHFVSPL